jgi:TolB-like protein/Flp pilus assembly protein TadD
MNKPGEKTGFIEELKRRNVVRVGVAYLVSAWLLLQLADIVLENISAPQWIMQVFMLALGIGLPIALIFAWAFELTPEGIKREKDVDRSQSITPKTGRKLDFTIIGVLAVVIVLLLVDRFTGTESAMSEPVGGRLAAEKTSAPSIAVLPFVNMSSDPEQEYFSDGISEEILNALAGVKELKVAGRTSSFAFKGKDQDLRQIGETLGVDHILEGSVRKSGTTVRITAQLIQVDDGFHLWSDTYDRELINVFAIQDEISTAILEQMKKHLVGLEISEPLEVAQRTDPDVYDKYLLAKQRLYERKRLSIESAAELLDLAIAKDPAYAPAYAQRGIATLLLSERNYGELTNSEARSQSKLYLDKALQLDPELAEGWAGMGLYHANGIGENEQAIEVLGKALEINPNLIDASNWLQIAYGALGDNTRALEVVEDMVERDPLYPPGFSNAITMYNLFGQQDKSWALIERVRPFLPGDPQILQSEANTWLSLGQHSKALPLLDEALETQATDGVLRNLRGWGLIQTGQFERAINDGMPWHKAIALGNMGRREEALILAKELADTEGFIGLYLGQLDRSGQYQKIVEFIEPRFPDLAAVEAEYPDDGSGFGLMLAIAQAYSKVGNEAQFNDAMKRIRIAHDRSIEQGIKDFYFLAADAQYWALAGDPARAIALLGQAVDRGMVVPLRFDQIWPATQSLSGDAEFEAIQARMFEHLNIERAALGLEPMRT